MKHRFAPTLVVLGLALLASAVPGGVVRSADAEGATELRIATLAPSGSSWMRIFNAWNSTLQKETDNTLKLRFYTGGSQGDERDFVRKMRAGQMDGAAVTTTGLGMVVRSILVLALPDVITDTLAAQHAMRRQVRGVGLALMLASTLHAIATGNLLPATVRTVCVDINPAVVTKLTDRGSFQSIGVVSDTESFLRELLRALRL